MATGDTMINTPDRQNNRKIVAMDDTLADPLTGRLLDGRYAVTARIAHGGMATVYKATDTRLDREVALKVMHAELARDEEFRHRFIGEAKSVARLSHQNVVAVFDQGADGPFLYLAMEFVPGRTLKGLLRDSGRFAPATALEIMAGVLDGLAAAHASGIVHRDVKPENVLVTADGRVKVADFGLARALSTAGHTRTGLLIGTVGYVPPEQVTGGPHRARRGRLLGRGHALRAAHRAAPVHRRHPAVHRVPARQLRCPGAVHAGGRHSRGGRPARAGGDHPGSVPAAAGRDRVRPRGPPGQGRAGRTQRAHRRDGGRRAGAGRGALAGPGHARGDRPVQWRPAPRRPVQATAASSTAATARIRTRSWWTATSLRHTDGGRHQGGGYHGGGREPFLGRWLFGPRLAIVALVVVLGVGLGLGGWWLTSGRFTEVPTISDVSVNQATAVLTADGFAVRSGQRQVHSNTVAKGSVVGTSPSGRVAKGTAVTILVSSGPFTSAVPRVKGEKQEDAQAALQRVHLIFTVVKVASTAPVGTVTGTKPAAGTTWPQTKPVTIMVAAGPPLPDFTGMDIGAAQQLAGQDKVTLQQQQDNNSQQAKGIITGQQPTPGGVFQPGQTVVVQVSTGPQLVAVPRPDRHVRAGRHPAARERRVPGQGEQVRLLQQGVRLLPGGRGPARQHHHPRRRLLTRWR